MYGCESYDQPDFPGNHLYYLRDADCINASYEKTIASPPKINGPPNSLGDLDFGGSL